MTFIPNGIATLLTDLGVSDPYAGILKGAMLSRFPAIQLIDLAHGVPKRDVAWAAYALAGSYKHFPPGTVHCAVVDPLGVAKGVIVAKVAGHAFVAPNNGLLSRVLQHEGSAWLVDLERVPVAPVRRVLHTRDVVAIVGAMLSGDKIHPQEVGPEITDFVELPIKQPVRTTTSTSGVIVGEDQFGNLFSSISDEEIPEESGAGFVVEICGQELPLCDRYNEVAEGHLVALFNAEGLLEIAVNHGRAADELRCDRGSPIQIRLKDA